MLRVHMVEPGSDSLQLTDSWDVDYTNHRRIALEPSRSVLITEIIGLGVQVRDWTRDRAVELTAVEPDPDDIFVRTFRG